MVEERLRADDLKALALPAVRDAWMSCIAGRRLACDCGSSQCPVGAYELLFAPDGRPSKLCWSELRKQLEADFDGLPQHVHLANLGRCIDLRSGGLSEGLGVAKATITSRYHLAGRRSSASGPFPKSAEKRTFRGDLRATSSDVLPAPLPDQCLAMQGWPGLLILGVNYRLAGCARLRNRHLVREFRIWESACKYLGY